MAVGESVSEVR